MVRSLKKTTGNIGKDKEQHRKSYCHGKTITIKQGRIVHLFSANICPDPEFKPENTKLGYMEDYFLDEQSQLQKRIAIGDKSYLKKVPKKHKKMMENIIEDIQTQMLTHNGFVTRLKQFRNEIQQKIEDELTQYEKEYDEKHQNNLISIETSSEEESESLSSQPDEVPRRKLKSCDPLLPVSVDKQKMKSFRKQVMEKREHMTNKRQEIKKHILQNRSLQFKMPFKNPTTIQQRTHNDPRQGVAVLFIPNDQPKSSRAGVYKIMGDDGKTKLQSVDERNAEYDLLAYPLFFPEGNKYKFGWTYNIPKVVERDALIEAHFLNISKNISETELNQITTIEQKVNAIKNSWNVKNLKPSHFDYKQVIDMKKRCVPMRDFYNFLYQERAGPLKKHVMTPKRERHQYKQSCNLKIKDKDKKLPVLDDEVVFRKKVKINDKKYPIRVHPRSRVPYYVGDNDEMIPFSQNPDGSETNFREKEKKNPLLYGGRLTLFHMLDMGMKVENNDLNWYRSPEMQKKSRKMEFRQATKLARSEKEIEDEGEPVMLPSGKKKSYRWYNEQFQDAMCNTIKFGNVDLFVTVTGHEEAREVLRLKEGRKTKEMIAETNRIFNIKLKNILHDIVIKQVFGRVVGQVYVIEYQKRGITFKHHFPLFNYVILLRYTTRAHLLFYTS